MGQDAVKMPISDTQTPAAEPAQPLTEADKRRLEVRRRVTLAVDQIRALARS